MCYLLPFGFFFIQFLCSLIEPIRFAIFNFVFSSVPITKRINFSSAHSCCSVTGQHHFWVNQHIHFSFSIFIIYLSTTNYHLLSLGHYLAHFFVAVSENCIRSADQKALEAAIDEKFKRTHLLSTLWLFPFPCLPLFTCHHQTCRLIYYLTTQARTILQSLFLFLSYPLEEARFLSHSLPVGKI